MKEDDIITLINTYLSPNNTTVVLGDVNSYYRDYDFLYVQNTDNFSPTNKQDILNIYYTAINAGKSSFTFYCPSEYTDCIKEVDDLANNQDTLSNINNFVHPFNSFSHIETEYDSLGKVTITINKTYSTDEIQEINDKVDTLASQLINNNLSTYDNIKNIHDYIINNTKYDSDRSDNNIINYKSDTAYGPLFQGYAICGGYTDLMQLFLERMNIKSFRVSSDSHIWNAVYLNDTWLNLDLTWDDPVASDGNDYLEYNYFLVDTNTLLREENTQHIFDEEVFQEVKRA
jgi:hypothetical protein